MGKQKTKIKKTKDMLRIASSGLRTSLAMLKQNKTEDTYATASAALRATLAMDKQNNITHCCARR